jgi:hypothetical protein
MAATLARGASLVGSRGEEVPDDLAHGSGDIFRRDVAEDLADGDAAEHGGDRAGHSHAVGEWDFRIADEPEEACLEVFGLRLVARVVGDLAQGPLVALVEADEIAVGEALVHELLQERGPRGDDLALVLESVDLLEDAAADVVQAQVQLEQDVLLALEVVVERRLGSGRQNLVMVGQLGGLRRSQAKVRATSCSPSSTCSTPRIASSRATRAGCAAASTSPRAR